MFMNIKCNNQNTKLKITFVNMCRLDKGTFVEPHIYSNIIEWLTLQQQLKQVNK